MINNGITHYNSTGPISLTYQQQPAYQNMHISKSRHGTSVSSLIKTNTNAINANLHVLKSTSTAHDLI